MKKLIIIILISSSAGLWAQVQFDSSYHVEITGTPCPIFSFFKEERYPGSQGNSAMGYGFFVRGMWHPGRLLSVGIMSGYLFLASDKLPGNSGLSARLAAIPLQAVVSMQSGSVEIGIGMGSYLLISNINNGKAAQGIRSELALTFFGSYYLTFNKDLFIGPELKASYLSYRGIFSVMPSIDIRYNILTY